MDDDLNFDFEPNEQKLLEAPKQEQTDILEGVEQKGFSIDDEIESLKQPKQDYTDEYEDDHEDLNDFEKGADNFMDDKPVNSENAKKNASLMVRWFDNVFAFVLGWWSKEENFTVFKAEKSSLSILEESIEKGLISTGKDFEMPWYYGLFIEVPIAYANKIKLAIKKRKHNKAVEKAKKQAENNLKNAQATNVRRRNDEVVNEAMNEAKGAQFSTRPQHDHPNRKCANCGTPLKPQQKRFCSRECSTAHLNAEKKAKSGTL